MKDIDYLDRFFKHLYFNNVCEWMEEFVVEQCNKNASPKDLRRIFELIHASGLVKELNYIRNGTHPAIMLNDKGYEVMLKYGSYSVYLKEKDKTETLDQKLKKSTIRLNYATLIISLFSFIGGVLLSNPIKELWKLFLSIFG